MKFLRNHSNVCIKTRSLNRKQPSEEGMLADQLKAIRKQDFCAKVFKTL